MGYTDLKANNKHFYTENVYSSYRNTYKNLRMATQTEFKVTSEDILYLNSPLLVINKQIRNQPSLLSSLQSDVQQGLLNLSLKPVLKIDKKIKKNDKDEDRDTDRNAAKLKLKKKARSKINFDEEYDSVNDLLGEVELAEDVSPLPLARPSKPILKDTDSTGFIVKQKISPGPAVKKKKSSLGHGKKDTQSLVIEKPTMITLSQAKSVQELAEIFVVSTTDIIKSLFLKGISVTVNQIIDLNTSQKLGEEFGIQVILSSEQPAGDKKRIDLSSNQSSKLSPRPPVITIMGHVDHGKTTLLDKIRKTQIAKREAGGITQKIGAYEVSVTHKNEDKKLIFLDTPGHAAFSGMRSRGVSLTDIAVLVVAADDGVKPQTLEAIQHIKSSNVPIIVAINKIDKQDANVELIKEELAKHNVISEDWGGDTLMVPISAMQGTNIDTLLEMILLLAEMMELKADPNTLAEGTIIESNLDRTRGAVASVLVQNGTLSVGDILCLGGSIAKIRGMLNSVGENIRKAEPSSPVFLWGLTKVPAVGDSFTAFKNEKDAKVFAQAQSEENLSRPSSMAPSQLSENYNVSDSETKVKINLIIKTDTQGSAEAISSSLNRINDSKVQIRVLYACAGEITETDVEFASASSATLFAFNTTSASGAVKAAKNMAINISYFDVIYDLFDFVQSMIESLVGPQFEEKFIGSAIIKTVFPLAKSFVAGSSVIEGKINKASFVHIIRNNETIHKGFIDSIKRLKESVNEVSEGSECGIFLKEFDSWKEGDVLKAFELVPKKRNTF